eukprot:24114_5
MAPAPTKAGSTFTHASKVRESHRAFTTSSRKTSPYSLPRNRRLFGGDDFFSQSLCSVVKARLRRILNASRFHNTTQLLV